jgi:hypothetical protein
MLSTGVFLAPVGLTTTITTLLDASSSTPVVNGKERRRESNGEIPLSGQVRAATEAAAWL